MSGRIPCDIEAEQHLLGSLLFLPDQIPRAATMLRHDEFFSIENGMIFGALVGMPAGDVSLVSCKNELLRRGQLQLVGRGPGEQAGLAYLNELLMDWGHDIGGNLRPTIEAIKDRAEARAMLSLANRMAAEVKSSAPGQARAVREKFTSELAGLAVDAKADGELVDAGDAVQAAADHADAIARGEADAGTPSGFDTIDAAIGGLRDGHLIVIAANTSVGKSALAMSIAKNVASSGGGVLYVSLEMSKEDLAERLLSMVSKIDAARLRDGHVHEQEYPERAAAVEVIRRWRLKFLDKSVSMAAIRNQAMALAANAYALSGPVRFLWRHVRAPEAAAAPGKLHETLGAKAGPGKVSIFKGVAEDKDDKEH